MGVNVLVKDDIRNALMAAYYAGAQISNQSAIRDPESYSQGFRTAITMLAINFGIALPVGDNDMEPSIRRTFLVNHSDMLLEK